MHGEGVTRAFPQRTGTVIQAVDDGISMIHRARKWYNERTRWTVSISSDDRLYHIVHLWFVSEDADAEPPRAVKATWTRPRSRIGAFPDVDFDSEEKQGIIELYYDDRGQRTVVVSGHKVTVSLRRPDLVDARDQGYRSTQPDTISFHARSQEGRDAVIGMLARLAADQDKRKPALHLLSTWGDWTRRDDLPERSLDSVVLADGQMERIRQDIQHFLNSEADYVRRGVPYHRGYVLHGPPGTGKTSVVRALAAHFALDLWYAPLGDLQKDASLITLINQVRPGSILLLEDIDVFTAARVRDDSRSGLSMAGLLNALDGVATPHGLITFMNLNDLSVIDEAIVRRGRVDLIEEVGLPSKQQIADLYRSWYGVTLEPADTDRITFTGSTADVTEMFKQHMDDQHAALRELQTAPPTAD